MLWTLYNFISNPSIMIQNFLCIFCVFSFKILQIFLYWPHCGLVGFIQSSHLFIACCNSDLFSAVISHTISRSQEFVTLLVDDIQVEVYSYIPRKSQFSCHRFIGRNENMWKNRFFPIEFVQFSLSLFLSFFFSFLLSSLHPSFSFSWAAL